MTDYAIRTVREDDDVLVIEGLAIPFGGPFPGNTDSHGTRATRKTDFAWHLFPDRAPTDPVDVPARFVRPLTYQHGFDPAIGMRRIGGWSPMRQDKMGVWVQAQIDKHDEWHDAIKSLIDEKKLAFSSGSVEHWVDIPSDGAWRSWPVIELALTPTESNPWAQVAARAANAASVLVRVTGLRADEAMAEEEMPETPTPSYVPAAHASEGTEILAEILELLACEGDEPEHAALLRAAADAMTKFVASEMNETPNEDDTVPAYMSAMREGRRNSSPDLALIDGIHDASVALGATSHQPDGQATDDRSPDAASAERSAEPLTAPTVPGRDDAKAIRKATKRAIKEAARLGRRIGAAEADRLVG